MPAPITGDATSPAEAPTRMFVSLTSQNPTSPQMNPDTDDINTACSTAAFGNWLM
jgi:hypothetical protein